MNKTIPDWKTQPEEYRKYLKEEIPQIIIRSLLRKENQKKLNEKAS